MKTDHEFIDDKQRERYLRLRWSPARDDSEEDLSSDDPWDDREPGDADDYLLTALWNRIKCTPRLEERFPKEIVLGPHPQSRVNSSPTTRVTAKQLAHELSRLTKERYSLRGSQCWWDNWDLVANQDPLPSISEVRWALRAILDKSEIAPDDSTLDSLLDRAPALMMAFFFSRFWVRPFSSWVVPNGPVYERIPSLVKHLFVEYPVPGCLLNNWLSLNLPATKWVIWLILIGQGASLHKSAATFGWNIPQNFQTHFLSSPPDLMPGEACMWTEIMRIGGTAVEYRRLAERAAFFLDPTHSTSSGSHLHFWRETVKWMAKNRTDLTDDMCPMILSWAMHRYTEAEARELAGFAWKGWSPARAYELGLEYYYSRIKQVADYKWKPHNWNFAYTTPNGIKWSIVELTSGAQLHAEGDALEHCVAGYGPRCVAGHSAIFSLQREGKRIATIELDPHSRRLVQVRGKHNRGATDEELAIVNHWCANVVNRNAKVQE